LIRRWNNPSAREGACKTGGTFHGKNTWEGCNDPAAKYLSALLPLL